MHEKTHEIIIGDFMLCSGQLMQKVSFTMLQWRSQTRAHTGLGPGVSHAKVLRRRVSTATRLCTVALQQYCQCALDCTILSGNEDYARPLILGSLVLRHLSVLLLCN